ncbi:MAG: B12-binding domain-containing radical SAM protein [Acetobacteraceae bacterium]|nr:B12-binding domain-containing radical SAM protein [Acetobacteraceae bacterium]
MKVAIAYPPHPVPFSSRSEPLGAGYLAAVLAPHHDLLLVDGHGHNLPPAAIADNVIGFEPDLVAVSMPHNPQVPAGRELIRLLREKAPGLRIVAGGNLPTFRPQEFLGPGGADFVVRHEGEGPLRLLVEALERGRRGDLEQVPGLAWVEGAESGAVRFGPPPRRNRDLDALPFPARHLWPCYPSPYAELCLVASRGCPFACPNCSTSEMWMHQRFSRSPENVLAEVAELSSRYPGWVLNFVDDFFTAQRGWVVELSRSLEELGGGRLRWLCNTRPDFLDPDLIQVMGRSGCRGVFLGVESGSLRVLEALGKRITPDGVMEVLRACLDNGIRPNVSFMLGLPFEAEEDVAATLRLMERIAVELPRCEMNLRHVTPVVGTRLYEERERFGIDILDDDQFHLNLMRARIRTRHLDPDFLNQAYFTARILMARRQAAVAGGRGVERVADPGPGQAGS